MRFVYRPRGPSLLVAEGRLNTKGRAVASKSKTGRGVVTAPIFLLVPQVKLPKRQKPGGYKDPDYPYRHIPQKF